MAMKHACDVDKCDSFKCYPQQRCQ